MTNRFATLLFPFEANFIPRKCRKSRPGLFMGSDVVELREAAPGEAVPAFRIYDAPVDHLDSFEILAFEDKCWWPLTGIPLRDDPDRHDRSTAALLNEFATLEHDVLDLLSMAAERPSAVEETDLRHFDPSQRDPTLDRIKSKIHRNLLLHQGMTYALGGEPIHLSGGNGAVSSGADRSVYPSETGMRDPPGRFMRGWVQYALRAGNFFAANDQDRLAAEIEEDGPNGTVVEVLRPEMVRMCRPRLQMDALFRQVIKLRDISAQLLKAREESRLEVSRRRDLLSLTLPETPADAGDFAMTRDRLLALDLVHPILDGWPMHRFGAEYTDLHRDISLFKETERAFIAEHVRGHLTAEEDKALQSLSP